MNSFNLTLSGKHFICPSILNDTLLDRVILDIYRSLPFMTLNTSFQALLACKVSFEKSAVSLMGAPLQVTLSFSLSAFKIPSLSLTFGILIMMCLGVASLQPSCLGLSVVPGLACLFLSPSQGSFLSFLFQIVFQFLALFFSLSSTPMM